MWERQVDLTRHLSYRQDEVSRRKGEREFRLRAGNGYWPRKNGQDNKEKSKCDLLHINCWGIHLCPPCIYTIIQTCETKLQVHRQKKKATILGVTPIVCRVCVCVCAHTHTYACVCVRVCVCSITCVRIL